VRDQRRADLKDIPIKSKKHLMPEAIAREYAYMPLGAKQLMLCSPCQKPPLLLEACAGLVAEYDMGAERAGVVKVELRLKSDNFDISVPLKMLPYKTPTDPQKCFDVSTCYAVDQANQTVENHNRYITSLLSLFVRENGCTTSANHITLPTPPESMVENREMKLRDIFKDKYGSLLLAVHYLEAREINCLRDYPIEEAVDCANELAFREAIEKKSRKGTIRFRIPGSPAASWSGKEGERDSCGRRVKWDKGKHHSFLSPDAKVVIDNSELMCT
jgi:hypothetical protein